MKKTFPAIKSLLMVVVLVFPSHALSLEALVVSGKTSAGLSKTISFSLEEFESLAPLTEVTTSTPWHPVSSFSGISGVDFVERIGLDGTTLLATAFDDYSVTIPRADLTDLGLLFVTRLNGKKLTLREKGPIFVIYPFDDHPMLKSDLYYGRSIWQLKKITVE
jgi:hypothetical protein